MVPSADNSGVESQNEGVQTLRLLWRDRERHDIHHVGNLKQHPDLTFEFRYVDLLPESFAPPVQFADTQKIYRFSELPAFFTNRVMDRKRPSFSTYVCWLGLDESATDFEILARNGGTRATDPFHVIKAIDPLIEGAKAFFFTTGQVAEPEERFQELVPGTELIPDVTTRSSNSFYLRLSSKNQIEVGHVPTWVVEHVLGLINPAETIFTLEQINLDAPRRLKVLCSASVKPQI